jgi:hypothetical protein
MKTITLLLLLAVGLRAQPVNEYAQTIKSYYEYLKKHEYKKAYEILSPANMTIGIQDTENGKPNGRSSFGGPEKFDKWQERQKTQHTGFRISKMRELNNLSQVWKEHMVLGMRCYDVTFVNVTKDTANPDVKIYGRFIWLIKGTDNKVRILGIGTGP